MTTAGPLPEKRALAETLLATGAIMVHLDARARDVVVPRELKHQPNLVLQIGYGLDPPIPDLLLDPGGFIATLSFQQVPFRCQVPWAAVFAIVGLDRKGSIWEADAPPEALLALKRNRSAPSESLPQPATIEVRRTRSAGGAYRDMTREALEIDARAPIQLYQLVSLVLGAAIAFAVYRLPGVFAPLRLVVGAAVLVGVTYAGASLNGKIRIRIDERGLQIRRHPLPLAPRLTIDVARLKQLVLSTKATRVELLATLRDPPSFERLLTVGTMEEAEFIVQEIELQLGRPLS